MRYKAGDKVKVKSLEELKKISSGVEGEDLKYEDGNYLFLKEMFDFCGGLFTIEDEKNEYYYFKENDYIFEDWMLETIKPNSTPRNKYDREIVKGVYVDVYDVLRAFEVTDQALGHLIKKALAVGKRGHKTAGQDYKDILDSAQRAYDQYIQWNEVDNG